MKKQLLNIFIPVALVVFAILFSSFINGDGDEEKSDAGKDLVIVRTYEIFGRYPSQIIFAWEDGTTETVALASLKHQHFINNMSIIAVELNKLKNKGYELLSSNGGVNEGMVVNTYVFQKE